MAVYTLTTSPAQEAVLQWVVRKANVQRETNLTAADYIAVRFPELLAPFAEAYKQDLSDRLAASYQSADAGTQAQIRQLLNIA